MSFLDHFRFKRKPFKETKIEETKKEVVSDRVSLPPSPFSHILIRPHLSEKSVDLSERSSYVFVVHPKANKIEVKQAIKALYGVTPSSVRIIQTKGKRIRFGKSFGTTRREKKAIVSLPLGKKIDVYA